MQKMVVENAMAKGEVTLPIDASGRLQRRESRTWRRFRRHKLAVIGATVLTLLVMVTLMAPLLPLDPYITDVTNVRQAPSTQHWLGTDGAGRDILARLLYAGRISLSVGLVSVSISVVIGVTLGAISGYYGGLIDDLIVRITEAIMCFPGLLIIITAVSFLGPSIYNVMLVLGFLGWTGICRLVRGEILSLRNREYVIAAQMVGAINRRIIWRHILPNALSPVIVAATFGVAGAILTEAGLSFLGLGVQPPTPSWGNMLTAARGLPFLEGMPWLWLPPGLMITISVLCINFIGDALRDALDPRTSG